VFKSIYLVFVNISYIIRCFIFQNLDLRLQFFMGAYVIYSDWWIRSRTPIRDYSLYFMKFSPSVCACKTTTKKDEWPGGLAYDSDVIQVWFSDSESQSNVQYHLFNLSLLKNDREFYCCLRVSWKNCISYFPFPSAMTSANRIALISLRSIILRSASKNWTVPWFPHLIHLKHKKMRNASTTWLIGCLR